MQRNMNNDDYVAKLEVKELKFKLAMVKYRKQGKKELCELCEWNEQDLLFSNMVLTFCKEFLFPRYKFLGKN